MAHFRNIETNSSSLSYSFPPPTTIRGMIAAILGLERESYFETFSIENSFAAIKCLSKNRKIIQTLNFQTYKEDQITQIPQEIIVPEEKNGNICYRIFFAVENKELQEQLKKLVSNNKQIYPVSMGIASFICSVKYIGEYVVEKVKAGEKRIMESVTCLDNNYMEVVDWGTNTKIFHENMRRYFLPERKPGDMIVLANIVEGTITIKAKDKVYDIIIDGIRETVFRT